MSATGDAPKRGDGAASSLKERMALARRGVDFARTQFAMPALAYAAYVTANRKPIQT